MMRLIRKLLKPMPTRRVSETEQDLIARRVELDAQIEAEQRQQRQKSAIYLLEQEVAAVTAGRYQRVRRRQP